MKLKAIITVLLSTSLATTSVQANALAIALLKYGGGAVGVAGTIVGVLSTWDFHSSNASSHNKQESILAPMGCFGVALAGLAANYKGRQLANKKVENKTPSSPAPTPSTPS